MPNFLRRPLKSSRNSRNGYGRDRDRYGNGAPRNAGPSSAAGGQRIGPMLDDRRIDPSIQTDPSRIGPMDSGGRANSSGYGERARGERGYGDREGRPGEGGQRQTPVLVVRRRTPGGSREGGN